MNIEMVSGFVPNLKESRTGRTTRLLALVLLLSAVPSFSQVGLTKEGPVAEKKAPTVDVLWRDADIEVRKVTIAAGLTWTLQHSSPYVLLPLTECRVVESIRSGGGHGPWVTPPKPNAEVAWVSYEPGIRFVHPESNEPTTGRTIFNDSDKEYVALEIVFPRGAMPVTLQPDVPTLKTRYSLLSDHGRETRTWRLGKYALSVRHLEAGEVMNAQVGTEGILFSMSPLTLGVNSIDTQSLRFGEVINFQENTTLKNLTTLAATLVTIEKPAINKLMAMDVVRASEGTK